jgi:hypothetical protein
MTEELTEQELLDQQQDDPEAYVERVQEIRSEEEQRAHDEENIARARSGRPSIEEEEEANEKAAKDAEAAAKKAESKEKAEAKAEDK